MAKQVSDADPGGVAFIGTVNELLVRRRSEAAGLPAAFGHFPLARAISGRDDARWKEFS